MVATDQLMVEDCQSFPFLTATAPPPPLFFFFSQVLTDRLMAGMYPSFPAAMRSIIRADGLAGFYTGWWPALAQKIPSYGYDDSTSRNATIIRNPIPTLKPTFQHTISHSLSHVTYISLTFSLIPD